MTRKRRMFDIEMPDETAAAPRAAPEALEPAPRRRGPMASAISENAEALKARKQAAEAIRIENDALAHEYVALKAAGHVVQAVPLEEVHTFMLVRDRMPGEDAELEELMTSIRDLGLSNPIRVLPRPDGTGFELVQGYRRLAAYHRLREEAGGADWDRIPALVLEGEGGVDGLYRRMVDENVIRKDLSFAEMAHAAANYAADPATAASNLSDAVAALFQSAPYSKRSYIRSFAYLLDRIGSELAFPTEIPRALGVSLARQLKDKPEIADRIKAELDGWADRSIAEELEVLRRFVALDKAADPAETTASASRRTRSRQGGTTKTTFHIHSRAGQVKCTAGQGRLEIKVDRDFSSIDRGRLERAIASLIDGLG